VKKVLGVVGNSHGHWVGDGFPVRTLFSYDRLGEHLSPFLLFDYGGPHRFEPSPRPRGVGQHPHRGFETVTIVYDGEVAHSDSTGQGGVIGPGDVQWMTAGSGILHEEFHSPRYSATGGPFRMVQLWVNLPAKDKMAAPGYQPIGDADIPVAHLPGGGSVRVIAGEFQGVRGPARTFTPVNLWDVRLTSGGAAQFDAPEGHTTALAVLAGAARINGQAATEAQVVLLERAGSKVLVEAEGEAMLLVMTGQPLAEPIVGQGPFVMNTEDEIRQAYADFRTGRFGQMADA
jgi:redox-sensitive bicupin YhaK (pirin superfamily)